LFFAGGGGSLAGYSFDRLTQGLPWDLGEAVISVATGGTLTAVGGKVCIYLADKAKQFFGKAARPNEPVPPETSPPNDILPEPNITEPVPTEPGTEIVPPILPETAITTTPEISPTPNIGPSPEITSPSPTVPQPKVVTPASGQPKINVGIIEQYGEVVRIMAKGERGPIEILADMTKVGDRLILKGVSIQGQGPKHLEWKNWRQSSDKSEGSKVPRKLLSTERLDQQETTLAGSHDLLL
jgi:hypothetical protein